MDWGQGSQGQQVPETTCGPVHTHVCKCVSQEAARVLCSSHYRARKPGPWAGAGAGPTCRSRPARSSSGPSTRTRVTAQVPPWPGGCSGLLLGFGASALSAGREGQCQ